MNGEHRDFRGLTEADIAALRRLLGDARVHTDERALERASGDALADRTYRTLPACIIRPEHVEHVSLLLEWAGREG
ncbi:MAG: hypothetical protein ACOCZ9_03615, partial [Spirochaetota bacterium]